MDDTQTINATPKPVVPLLPYQQADVESPMRFVWSCWARQTGKSFTKSLRRILRGLMRSRTQVFLSAGERQTRELMLKAQQHCQALKIASEFFDSQSFAPLEVKHLEIQLPNRVRIIGLPANPQTVRGFTGDVLLDEFAMHTDDRDIWAAVLPSVLREDGEVDVASTPKGCLNMFAKLRDNDLFTHTTVTLPDAIEQGLQVDAEAMRQSVADEEIYRQEFLCEFLDESTAFLTYRQIAGCEDPMLSSEPDWSFLTRYDGDLFVGVDIGRRRDLTVIWLLRREADQWITSGWIEMQNAPFRQQYAELTRVLSLPGVRRCCIDSGGLGMQLAEQAVGDFGEFRVEALTLTAALKSELAGRLRIHVENGAIRIPVDERLRNDWHSIQKTVTTAGHIRLDAQRSEFGHADRFWAAALAVHAAGETPAKVEQLQTRPLQFARNGIW